MIMKVDCKLLLDSTEGAKFQASKIVWHRVLSCKEDCFSIFGPTERPLIIPKRYASGVTIVLSTNETLLFFQKKDTRRKSGLIYQGRLCLCRIFLSPSKQQSLEFLFIYLCF